MDQISQFLIYLILVFSLFNFLSLRSIRPGRESISESVAVLIPMRNEAANAEGVLSSVLAQVQLENFAVRALDDGSVDATPEILAAIKSPRFAALAQPQLPNGWLGKNYALHSLASQSKEEFLVFLDADVRLEKTAISDSIALMKRMGWDFISPYPKQIAHTYLAKLVQPLLQWSWFSSLPLRLVERSSSTSTVVANGQFFIVRNSMYQRVGGHKEIKGEVLDDLELARLLRRNGGIGTVVDGSKIANCEMYPDSKSLIAGYSKSQWRAFGSSLGALLAITILFLSSVYPVIRALQGEMWGLIGYLLLISSRLLAGVRTRSILSSSLFHPLAIIIWILLICRSLILKRMGRLHWRGRLI